MDLPPQPQLFSDTPSPEGLRAKHSFPEETQAIVSQQPTTPGSPNWALETVQIAPLEEDEVLVKILAVGICHTDVITTAVEPSVMGVEYPRIAGHEGAGIIINPNGHEAKLPMHAPVILSLTSCGICAACEATRPTHCPYINQLNFNATMGKFERTRADGSKEQVVGSFFGQSSFARHAVVKINSVISVKNLVDESKLVEELKLFCPMGCGFMAGAGTVVNLAQIKPEDRVMITGLGAVGLAAIMAAKIAGCQRIIAFDRIENRLDLAVELGATNAMHADMYDKEALQEMTNFKGLTVIIDTTGVPALIELGLQEVVQGGKMILVGTPPPGSKMDINLLEFMQSGKQLISSIEGSSVPWEFIPQMISWYREGKFPIDKLVKSYKMEDFSLALKDIKKSETVKPVLHWDD